MPDVSHDRGGASASISSTGSTMAGAGDEFLRTGGEE